jgi:N-acetyl-gamma-glutamyl-phosphate reductase
MLKVGIVGASGYSGAELVRLLTSHSEVELKAITSTTYQGKSISDIYPNLLGFCDLEFTSFNPEKMKKEVDVVFLALPHGVSMETVPFVLNDSLKVIDLSGDFRLKDPSLYEKWYGISYKESSLEGLKKAVYGLSEIEREEIKKSNFVSNPGCYPTSILLGIFPLLKEKAIKQEGIIVDSKSGLTGAGRTLKEEILFSECAENMKAYGIGEHKHIPEIEEEMSKIYSDEIKIFFTPHLVPVKRGILSTIYCDLKDKFNVEDILDLYKRLYQNEEFIKILPLGKFPETKNVVGSNYCHIGIKVDERTSKVIVISAIDNLIKGAAGQAIQNMNIMCGLKENTGLKTPGFFP